MFSIDIIAVGKVKKGAWADLVSDYVTRLKWNTKIIEVESKLTDERAQQEHEQSLILEKLDMTSTIIILDERGKSQRSIDFAKTIEKYRDTGVGKITFIIGGANGLNEAVREKSSLMLSFGTQTWPHVMVRVMLLEQIYRAQQILVGHPYHREG